MSNIYLFILSIKIFVNLFLYFKKCLEQKIDKIKYKRRLTPRRMMRKMYRAEQKTY